MVNRVRNWSKLSPKLLSAIGDRLDNSIDVLRFRSVCISWRRSVPPFHLPSPLPYINPPDTNPRYISTGLITETFVYRLQPLQNPSSPPKAWLIMVREDPDTREMKLLNPLSGDEIEELPESFPRLFDLYDLRITKICSFSEAKRFDDPNGFMDYEPVAPLTLSTGDVVVVRMGIFSLNVLKLKDKSETWRLLFELQHFKGVSCFLCIVNFNGKVYALDTEGYCSVVDADLNITRIGSPSSKDYNDWNHLVISLGELLLVNTLTTRDEDSNRETIGFRVYRLDEEDRWVPVTNLGDRILFAGRSCSFSVSANDFGCLESNCIFNLGIRDDNLEYEEDEYDSLRKSYCWEPEILNLGDNSVRTLVSSPGCGDIFWPPPSWLTPVDRSSILTKKMDSTEEECKEIVEPPQDSSRGSDGEDIISSLPNSVLCHILSKLPTKYAVGTSILSSQWRHLFSSIPNPRIDIDDTLLLHPPDSADGGPHQSTRNIHFINFMNHFFNVTLRDVARFSKLFLHFHHDYGNTTIKELITAASRFQVCHLDLHFTVDGCGVSFDDLSNFTSVVSLFLTQKCALPVPDSLGFSNLTELFLSAATFNQSDGLERVLNACPLLEDLCLDRCHFPASEVLRISVQNLRMLMICRCYHDDMYEVVIHTPNLIWFCYNDTVAEGYSLVDFSSLQRADIHLGLNDDQLGEDDWSVYCVNTAEIIRACYNVSYLYLNGMSILVSCDVIHPLPIFRNLIELSLVNLNVNGWELLPHLLQNSPNLRALIFEEGIKSHEGYYSRFQSSLPDSVPKCLSSRLLKVKFERFKGEEDELKLVEYFLRTALVLRELKVCLLPTLPMEEMKRIWSSVKALPRSSKNCTLRYM